MSNKDIAEMIDIAVGIMISFGMILWFWLYLKLDKIYDELKEIRKEKKEVKHGKWNHNKNNDAIKCSMCGFGIIREYCGTIEDNPFKFCPNCGADMRGSNEK